MIYNTYQNVYFQSSADTLEYVIKRGDEYIFRGIAVKAPGEEYAYINVGDICSQYLDNQMPDFMDFSGNTVTQEEMTQEFSLYEVVLEKEYTCPEEYIDYVQENIIGVYTFLYNWSYGDSFDSNGDLVLSDPVNGHIDCRMKGLFSAYYNEGFEETDLNKLWEEKFNYGRDIEVSIRKTIGNAGSHSYEHLLDLFYCGDIRGVPPAWNSSSMTITSDADFYYCIPQALPSWERWDGTTMFVGENVRSGGTRFGSTAVLKMGKRNRYGWSNVYTSITLQSTSTVVENVDTYATAITSGLSEIIYTDMEASNTGQTYIRAENMRLIHPSDGHYWVDFGVCGTEPNEPVIGIDGITTGFLVGFPCSAYTRATYISDPTEWRKATGVLAEGDKDTSILIPGCWRAQAGPGMAGMLYRRWNIVTNTSVSNGVTSIELTAKLPALKLIITEDCHATFMRFAASKPNFIIIHNFSSTFTDLYLDNMTLAEFNALKNNGKKDYLSFRGERRYKNYVSGAPLKVHCGDGETLWYPRT